MQSGGHGFEVPAKTSSDDGVVYRGTGIVAREHDSEHVDHVLVIRLLIIRHWVSTYFPSVSSLERNRRSEENVRHRAYRRKVPEPLERRSRRGPPTGGKLRR